MPRVATVAIDPERARVYEHGWQSWSPTGAYRLDERPARPVTRLRRVGNYRPDRDPGPDAFWGEGLLAVDPGDGGVHVFATDAADVAVPSITAEVVGTEVRVAAESEVEHLVLDAGGPARIDGALARWAQRFATAHGVGPPRPTLALWCSWYHYFTGVTEADVDENLVAIGELDLAIDVVQIDDGYQAGIGDWLALSDRFASLAGLVGRVRAAGRRAGIWVAPFLVGGRSELARRHPEWVIGDAGYGWDQPLAALDITHPGAEAYLREVFGTLHAIGVDFFKIDFIYAGALEGRRAEPGVTGVAAYRHGLRVIREAIGPQAYLLGCGAPILPSVGLVDAMRVGPDIAHHYEPADGDESQPAQRTAACNSRWRAFQHGRFWANDADCLVAGPHVQRREEWAGTVERWGGLRGSSDRLRTLDAWGLETTRRLVRAGDAVPFF